MRNRNIAEYQKPCLYYPVLFTDIHVHVVTRETSFKVQNACTVYTLYLLWCEVIT